MRKKPKRLERKFSFDIVMYEFNNAYLNRVNYTNNRDSLMWKGITPSGVEVRGYEPTNRNPNATAYPKR